MGGGGGRGGALGTEEKGVKICYCQIVVFTDCNRADSPVLLLGGKVAGDLVFFIG
jgi:hypothetical protein